MPKRNVILEGKVIAEEKRKERDALKSEMLVRY
jgi:hypothetical protein